MSKKNAIILGGMRLNRGVYKRLKELDFHVIVADSRTNIEFDCDEHLIFHAEKPEIALFLNEKGYKIDFVYTSADGAGLAQRAICKEYNLLYAPKEAILNAHHKDKMHKAWHKAGLLNRKSFAINVFDYEQIQILNKDYKIVVKPSNACASRGLTVVEKNAGKNTIENAFNLALKHSTNGYVNIEEFIEGTEYTVEIIGDNFDNVTVFAISQKYHTKNTKSIVATKLHYNPQNISLAFQEEIAKIAIKCYKSLELKNTFGHLEIIQKKDKSFSPVEIGARSSGYIASHFMDLSANICALDAFYKVQHGVEIQNGLLKQSNTSSMYFFYDLLPNSMSKKSTHILNFLDKSIISHDYDRNNLIRNKTFTPIACDTERYGFEILEGNKDILTIEHVLEAEKNFIKDMFYG